MRRVTGTDLTKLMQLQFVVVGFCLFFSSILISSEFLLICKNPGISGTLMLFCLFLFLFEYTGHPSFLHEADVADWVWLMHSCFMTCPCNLDIFRCAPGTPVISSALGSSRGFAILMCRCFAPPVCPTPKS